jgi:hypothetical protein
MKLLRASLRRGSSVADGELAIALANPGKSAVNRPDCIQGCAESRRIVLASVHG